jgi:hypothetical protein
MRNGYEDISMLRRTTDTLLTVFLALCIMLAAIPGSGVSQEAQDSGSLFGTITDRITSETLPGASVRVADEGLGAMTNLDGEYTVDDIAPGTYNVRFSMIGFRTLVKTNVVIRPGRATELSVQLDVAAVELDAITVTSQESYFEEDPEAEVSGRTIDAQEIMNQSGGLMDIQRVVQVLPSVTTGSDQMNEIIVRGGNYGENLFIMDGIEIPNPNHFAYQGAGGGPISLLRSEFIRDVSFVAGAFPARFGDKASSVTDITLRRGSTERLMTNLDMGMAGIGALAEGPAPGGGSFLISARKSFLDLIIANTGLTAVPQYYNLQSKFTWQIGGRHTLLWNSVYGDDSIEIRADDDTYDDDEDENVNAANGLVVSGLNLKSILTKNLVSDVVVSHVRNDWSTDVWEKGHSQSDLTFNNQSIEAETTARADLTWFLGEHDVSGGVSVKRVSFDHDIFADPDTVHTFDTAFATTRQDTITGDFRTYPEWRDKQDINMFKTAVYGQVRLHPVPRLTVRLGGRYDRTGYIDDWTLAPRVGVRYRLSDTFSVSSAYGVHYQSPSYILMSSHADNKSLTNYHTRQWVAGTEWLPRPDTRMTFEVYSKRYRDVVVPQSWTTVDPWDSSEGRFVNSAKGHTEGIELYLHRKMSSSYMYILSYSYYRAFFTDPRTGAERPWDFDHRNLFTATVAKRWDLRGADWYQGMRGRLWYKVLSYFMPFGDDVLLSAKWRYAGGRPYTEQQYLREYHSWIVPADGMYNSERFPSYHRMDLRLDRRYYFRNWSLVLYLDIMNVYNRENVWDYSRDDYGVTDQINQFETLPVGGFSIEF